MIEVETPDGAIIEFPPDTSDDVIKGVMAKQFGAPSPAQAAAPTVGMGEAMGRGAVQGATLGFGDELAGAGAASPLPMNPAGKTTFGNMSAPDVMLGGLMRMFGRGGDAYTAERDRVRASNDQAQKERPYSYGGGEIAGSLATAAVPGLNIARTAGIGRQVVQGAATGAGLGAVQGAGQAKELADVPGEAAKGSFVGAGAGMLAPVAIAGLTRAISPLPISAERLAALTTLRREGIQPTAGQATGSKAVRWAESALGDLPGGGGAARQAQQGEQFTAAVMRRAGSTENRATQDTIDDAFTRLGRVFDDVGSRNTLRMDARFAQDMGDAVTDYVGMVPPNARAPVFTQTVGDLIDISRTGAAIDGAAYNAMRSRIDKAARAAYRGQNSDPQLGAALHGIRDALDGAFERSISGADQTAIRAARRQYGNLIPISKASTMAGEGIGEGILSPGAMRTQVAAQNRGNFARGRGDLAELTKAAQAIMTPLPNSGTAPRQYMQGLLTGGGALAGGSIAGIQGAALGLAAPVIAARLLHSRPVQGYLSNQAAAGGIPALARLAAPLRQQLVAYEHRKRQSAGR